jgi:hypothetical protein
LLALAWSMSPHTEGWKTCAIDPTVAIRIVTSDEASRKP